MNTVKSQYIAAKLEYQRARNAQQDDMEPHGHLLDSDEGIEEYVDMDMAAERRHDVRAKQEKMEAAEKEMFKWAAGVIRKDKAYKPVADKVEPLLEILTGQRKPKVSEMSAIVGKGHDDLLNVVMRMEE